jgi:hypothetical protein
MNNRKLTLALALTVGFVSPTTPILAANISTTVLASSLNNPRGITLGPDGKLYIALAGRGGNGTCIPSGSGQGEVCYGPTSAITRLDPTTGTTEILLDNLPSLAQQPSGDEGTGVQDLYFDQTGQLFGIIGLGTNPDVRDNTLNIPTFGQAIAIDLSGTPSWSPIADLADFERDNNPDGGEVDSNPYSIVVQNDIIYATDAGGNSLLRVDSNGDITAIATFPVRLVTPPPFIPNLPNPFPMQAVPTGIAIGPDNQLYIGQLTGFPFPVGGANVYRFNGTNLEEFATGFTNIIDIAFAPDGSLYVLEYASNFLAGDFGGQLWKIASDGTRESILDEGLSFPTGLAIGDDGAIYVANQGFIGGQGQILKITSTPEMTSAIALGITGLFSLRLRSRKS